MNGIKRLRTRLGAAKRRAGDEITIPNLRFRKKWMIGGPASQADLADELGVSQRVVEEWEAGRRTPNADNRAKIEALEGRLSPKGHGEAA